MLDGVISASFASKRVMDLRFNLPCKTQVVINRIKTPSDISLNEKRVGEPIRLGTASRLVTLKGISVSILTMKELVQRGYNVTMEIAGKGPDLAVFEEMVLKAGLQERCFFSGFQHNIADFFNRVDIYMSTPVTEPFGLSCMEALYYGVPVIFPLIDGQPEVVKDGLCGLGVVPTVTIEEHMALSGIQVDFPHKVYDPIGDRLVEPKLMSHILCANAVEKLLHTETYRTFSKNAQYFTTDNFSYDEFKEEFDHALQFYIGNQ